MFKNIKIPEKFLEEESISQMLFILPILLLGLLFFLNFYINRYKTTFFLDIGSNTDTNVTELYLEPEKSLSDRKINENNNYREINGAANIIFKPKNFSPATVTADLFGNNIFFIAPQISFKDTDIQWEYNWDFSTSTPLNLMSNVYKFDDEFFWDGKVGVVELPNSANLFEDSKMTIYAEWKPRNNEKDFQQIAGHFNWELLQNTNSVTFQVGRMDNENGKFYSISYPIDETFFNKRHSLLATYSPNLNNNDAGYIEFYVDNNLAGRVEIGTEKIWKDYGTHNLSFGKSKHGVGNYFEGNIYKVKIANTTTENKTKHTSHYLNNNSYRYIILGNSSSTADEFRLKVND